LFSTLALLHHSKVYWKTNEANKNKDTMLSTTSMDTPLDFTSPITAFAGQLGHTGVALLQLSCGGSPCDAADLCKQPMLDGNTSRSPNTHPLLTVA
jgi:hypothetical protein